jgi:hypothetical protein
MATRLGWAAWALGATLAAAAGLVAPNQPEVFYGGAACQLAPCGTLEDPARWRAMWWLWGAGAALVATGVVVVVSGLPGDRRPSIPVWRWLLAAGFAAVCWVAVAGLALLAGLLGSAQLAAAVPVVFALPIGVAIDAVLVGTRPATRRSALATALVCAPGPLLAAGYLLLG